MTAEKKVPAIEKADKIFKYLYYKDSATQSEISKELNIPKATTNILSAFSIAGTFFSAVIILT